MDPSKQSAITACGRCGMPEDAHKFGTRTDPDDLGILAALGGPCTRFVVSDAAVIYSKHLGIVEGTAPRRRPDGSIGKRLPIHDACGHRHQPGACQIAPGPAPRPGAAARGAAMARRLLGLAPERREAS